MSYIPAALRRIVRERAQGGCEYCLFPEALAMVPHEVDHVVAQKHGGVTDADNLALSCTLCNEHKGSDIASLDPEGGALTALYHPRRDAWREHFDLGDGVIVGRSPAGRATARLLWMNEPVRVRERKLVLEANLLRVPG